MASGSSSPPGLERGSISPHGGALGPPGIERGSISPHGGSISPQGGVDRGSFSSPPPGYFYSLLRWILKNRFCLAASSKSVMVATNSLPNFELEDFL